MNVRGASSNTALDIAAPQAADTVTPAAICPACGYPTLNPSLCAYCRPLLAP